MSRRINKEVRVKEARTMLCTHCKNMGEPKAVYEGHSVRDSKGIILCPKIKKNVCNNCKKTGHLSSHCTFAKSEHRYVAKSENKVAVVAKPVVLNRFADLADSDSEDESPVCKISSESVLLPRRSRRDLDYWIELCGDSSDEE